LDKAVNVVILKEQALQLLEPLQLRDVARPDNVIEPHILKGDLLNCLLEVEIVEHLESVAVDEQLIVAFNFSVTALYEAL